MRSRWWAPAIVAALMVVGAHPFCNLMFHCGCSALALTAHCNIHAPAPPHCPWCAQPLWFALAALLALAGGGVAVALAWRRTMAFLPSLSAGLVGVVAGGLAGALLTMATR
ncbi:MAG TPA: hypothetical protein VGH63_08385 [Polyangia bacterium]